jgi:hypothetical protein
MRYRVALAMWRRGRGKVGMAELGGCWRLRLGRIGAATIGNQRSRAVTTGVLKAQDSNELSTF